MTLKKLRLTFQFELLRLIEETIGPNFKSSKNILYKKHSNGFYVYAKYMEDDEEYNDKDNSDNINACINYCMRYASRPAMAESRIIEYNHEEGYVKWFYHDHKDESLVNVCDDVKSFINKLIIHIPDKHFHCVRYYGFYSNKNKNQLDKLHGLLGDLKKRDYSKEKRKKKRIDLMNKLKYRTQLVDSFNRDPLKCSCGSYMRWIYTYNPLEGISNEREYRKNCINEMQELQLPRRSTGVGNGRTRRILT